MISYLLISGICKRFQDSGSVRPTSAASSAASRSRRAGPSRTTDHSGCPNGPGQCCNPQRWADPVVLPQFGRRQSAAVRLCSPYHAGACPFFGLHQYRIPDWVTPITGPDVAGHLRSCLCLDLHCGPATAWVFSTTNTAAVPHPTANPPAGCDTAIPAVICDSSSVRSAGHFTGTNLSCASAASAAGCSSADSCCPPAYRTTDTHPTNAPAVCDSPTELPASTCASFSCGPSPTADKTDLTGAAGSACHPHPAAGRTPTESASYPGPPATHDPDPDLAADQCGASAPAITAAQHCSSTPNLTGSSKLGAPAAQPVTGDAAPDWAFTGTADCSSSELGVTPNHWYALLSRGCVRVYESYSLGIHCLVKVLFVLGNKYQIIL